MLTTVEHPRLGEVVLSQSRRARRISISVRRDGVCPPVIPLRGFRAAGDGISRTQSRMGRGGPGTACAAACRTAAAVAACEQKARIEELRRAAKADLPDRIGRISRITGLKYNKLTIRASRTKWGSCTGTNNISLSLFLMVLPEHLRDFVIVHELCHTVHHDHSPKFHALVDRLVGGNEKALNRELKAFSIRG